MSIYDVTIQSMKITLSVTKSSHQDRGICFFFLHLTIFFLYIHSPFSAGKLKVVVGVILSKLEHRPLFNNIYYRTILV